MGKLGAGAQAHGESAPHVKPVLFRERHGIVDALLKDIVRPRQGREQSAEHLRLGLRRSVVRRARHPHALLPHVGGALRVAHAPQCDGEVAADRAWRGED